VLRGLSSHDGLTPLNIVGALHMKPTYVRKYAGFRKVSTTPTILAGLDLPAVQGSGKAKV